MIIKCKSDSEKKQIEEEKHISNTEGMKVETEQNEKDQEISMKEEDIKKKEAAMPWLRKKTK